MMKVSTDDNRISVHLRDSLAFTLLKFNEDVCTCRFITANVLQVSQNLVWPMLAVLQHLLSQKPFRTFVHVLLQMLSKLWWCTVVYIC